MKVKAKIAEPNTVWLVLPLPRKIPSEEKMKYVKEWQGEYMALSTEAVSLMFASECGAMVEKVEVEATYCILTLRFRGDSTAKYFLSLVAKL